MIQPVTNEVYLADGVGWPIILFQEHHNTVLTLSNKQVAEAVYANLWKTGFTAIRLYIPDTATE